MNQDSKYVVGIYRDPQRRSGPEGKFFQEVVALVFDPCMNHNEVADMVLMDVVSAGFVIVASDGVHCHGRSETLDVDSRPSTDEFFVKRALGMGGYRAKDNTKPPMTLDEALTIIQDRRSARFNRGR